MSKPVSDRCPLLSIAIPAYSRRFELEYCLERFVDQITGKYENDIEILISDDDSPGDSLKGIREYSRRYDYIRYRKYPANIGLERNLIACANGCSGEFLWIFGDDDFLEDGCLDLVMDLLRGNQYDFFVLNRTRRSFDLLSLISENWMKLDKNKSYPFTGLREFCLAHGFISIIGFISANIFRRKLFQAIDASKYMGTMYPQLGAMVEAFYNRKALLVGRPLVCHRTQTSEEKRTALGNKASEADFMADVQRRNAIYFSHPYIRMLAELIRIGAFRPEDIVRIPENTVINGLLIDFLIQTVKLSRELGIKVEDSDWVNTRIFFENLPLDLPRRELLASIYPVQVSKITNTKIAMDESNQKLTISVVTPSFNQAEFLSECLSSVQRQTYAPIEHLVYDPGSTDRSREIALKSPNVTLIAEPDTGQSDALNKGFTRSRGDIIAWLNSDDCYTHPKVFERVVQRFLDPDAPDVVYGCGIFVNEAGEKLRDVYINKDTSSLIWRFQQEDGILQPALFMKRSVIERIGPLRNDLHYCMDYEYWIRCIKAGIKFAFLNENLAIARYHSNNKTYGMRGKSYLEVCDMMKEHFGYVNHVWIKRYAEFLAEGHDGVLAHAGNAGIRDKSKFDNIYRRLLLAYNGSYDTYLYLLEGASQKGPGDTLREMKALQIEPPVPCKKVPIDQVHEPGYVTYVVGNRQWAFDAKWKAAQIAKTHEFFRDRIAKRCNDTCIIVGNGPSLNKTDLSLLKSQDVIVSNNAFLSSELLKYATYFTVVNYLVAEQSCAHINQLEGIDKVLPYWMSYCLNPDPNTYFVDAIGYPEFSKDIFKNMSWRHTVTFFNLHLAYGLGYRKVIMIGFDHTYKQRKGILEQELIQSYEEDENHFHPGYFRGKKWQAADVDMMEEMYRLAKVAFEEDGRIIINSTVGGKLELFPRVPLTQALGLGVAPVEESQLLIVIGPYRREDQAHWDETFGIRQFTIHNKSGTMIDVGAHEGYALMPFLNDNWHIFAFEPDNKNRTKLIERLTKHKNKHLISLDTRCVSNKSQKGVSFFTSEQSTGISGLSAFHESHVEAQKVDTTTLTEFFQGKPLPDVDFLKIDTEGHDLFVLQGFPWERGKPAVIECEFEDIKTVPLGYTFHDLARFLVDKGYTVYVSEWHPIIRYGIRHDWRQLMRYPCELADPKGWGNLLAFRDSVDEKDLVAAVQKVLKIGNQKLPTTPAALSVQPINPPAWIDTGRTIRFSGIQSHKSFQAITENCWRYCHSALEEQKLWFVTFTTIEPVEGRSYTANIRLISNQSVTARITLGRHGNTVWEGSGQSIRLLPNVMQNVKLHHNFERQHQTLKVQLEITELKDGDIVDLTIDTLSISESLTSIRQRIPSTDINLSAANRLFREKDYYTAMNIYLLLHQDNPLPLSIYPNNAIIAARKLGMHSIQTVEELLQRMG